MVYGYEKNEDFINDSQRLLDMLEKKNLWHKNTIILGLDKSVRPLAYTIRRLSQKEGKETPDIRFFNYSSHKLSSDNTLKNISYKLRKRLKPEKLSKYDKILVLDEHVTSGNTFRDTEKIIKKYFGKQNISPEISFAALGGYSNSPLIKDLKNRITFIDGNDVYNANPIDTGVKDKYSRVSKRLQEKDNYKKFYQNRRKLSKDIDAYLEENHKYKEYSKNTLEKAVWGLSIISLFLGIVLGFNGITGNIIGTSQEILNISGIILIALSILGLFLSKK